MSTDILLLQIITAQRLVKQIYKSLAKYSFRSFEASAVTSTTRPVKAH